jgi:hypothetical protein
MKKELGILLLLIATTLLVAQIATPSAVSWRASANFSGANKYDRLAAIEWIDQANNRRTNAVPAQAALPRSTNPEIVASVAIAAEMRLQRSWDAEVNKALKTRDDSRFTAEERGQIVDAIDGKIEAGADVTAIVNAINAIP